MHDFIGLIFYMFRRAVPPALIGLAVGAALLVPLNRKRRREAPAEDVLESLNHKGYARSHRQHPILVWG